MLFGNGGKYKRLYGAWEERGVIGTRIEIDKKTVTVLWRGAPVLVSGYSVKEDGGKLTLVLEKNGMRYEHSTSDYATVTELYEEDGKLTFKELFPISGPSQTLLTKTENNRYGNYDVVTDECLPLLAGSWKDDRGFYELTFRKDVLTIRGEKKKIVLLKNRSYPSEIIVHAEDPSADMIDGLTNIVLRGDMLYATIPVCDAPSMELRFTKQ